MELKLQKADHEYYETLRFAPFPCETMRENIVPDSCGDIARVVDTTGTGDSFAGGLLAGLLTHGDLPRAAREACACGALTAEVLGAHRDFGWAQVRARAATGAAAGNRPGGR